MCWITQKILFFIICLLPKKQEYLDKHLSNIIANRKPNIKKTLCNVISATGFHFSSLASI